AFSRIGARVRFADWPRDQDHSPAVRRDEEGEFFVLDLNKARDGVYGIQEVRPALWALILREDGERARYLLCRRDGGRCRLDGDLLPKSKTIESALRPARKPQRRAPRQRPRLTFVPAPTFQPAQVRSRAEPPVHRCRRLGFVAEHESRVEGVPGRIYVRG